MKGLSIETESPRPGTTGGSKVSLLNLHAPAICITPEGCPDPSILPWNLLALPIHPDCSSFSQVLLGDISCYVNLAKMSICWQTFSRF